MRGHVCALKHLCESTERANDTFQHLESGLRALVDPVRQTFRVVGVWHAAHSISSHAAITSHRAIATVAAVHASAVPSHAAITPIAAHPAVR